MEMPARIARLPRDKRGYPIPWNVLIGRDGIPLFTANDDRKHWTAIVGGLCPICGELLERVKWFIGGPRSAFDPNGWYQDLPAHRECAEFSLRICPFLGAPRYVHRIDVPDLAKVAPKDVILFDPTMIPGRPEVFVAVGAEHVKIKPRGEIILPVLKPLRPFAGIQYWRRGERLPREEGEAEMVRILGEWRRPEMEQSWSEE